MAHLHPWVSKSSLYKFDNCKYSYWKAHVLGERSFSSNIYMKWGTNFHELFENFFKAVDFDILWEIDWVTATDTKHSLVYNYFLSVMRSLITEKVPSNVLIYQIKSFSRMEENHWFAIRTQSKSKAECKSLFRPVQYEKKYVNAEYQLVGIVDRVTREDDKKILISDYKTGRIPISLKRSVNYVYCDGLPSDKVREGNFYCLLYLFQIGYKMMKNEKGVWQLYYNGIRKTQKDFKWLDYCFIYTNARRAYIGRKKFSVSSAQAIFRKIEKIRSWDKGWYREPNSYKCAGCELFRTDCYESLCEENEVYRDLLRSKIAEEKNVFKSNRNAV